MSEEEEKLEALAKILSDAGVDKAEAFSVVKDAYDIGYEKCNEEWWEEQPGQ